MKDFNFLQQKYIVNTYPNRNVAFVKGEGIFLIDESGQKYLDLMSNYGVSIFGHSHPAITSALQKQLSRIVTLHGSFSNDVRAEAGEALVKRCGSNYSQVYFSNSGAEAIEAALKFTVLATGKKKFLVAKHGYHGKTLGALSATDEEKYKSPFFPLLWEFTTVLFNNIKSLEQAIDEKVAAFIVEPVQGEGGINIAEKKYLEKVSQICKKQNILLIIDEIQTGNGRTGKFLASSTIAADILCLGKGIAGGIPAGATLLNKQISSYITRGIHTSTFGGNPLACAGILAVLNLLDDKQLTHIQNIGEYFIQELNKLKSPLIKNTRAAGLMIGIEVKSEIRNKILQLLQKDFILAIPAGENVVRLLPPYIIEKEHVDLAIEKFGKILGNSYV
jgi:acetylornithine/LysW-gamma-L-lysine aminotransferase